jgi:[protein-PII] uridylyltransferase
VTDAKTGLLANREERDKFEALMQKILTGTPVDLPALIAKARTTPPHYKSLEGERIPTLIETDNLTSQDRTILDVQAEDRVGLLYDISQTLADLNIRIYLAKILTEKGAAIDSFYVTERWGTKVLESERQKEIKDRLRKAVQRES